MNKSLVAAALLFAATLIPYLQVSGHEFVNFDDDEYITENAQVQAGLTVDGVQWAFTTGHAANWHPVTWLSHMVDCTLFGGTPADSGPHQLINAVLHAFNAMLLFAALRLMTGAFWRGLIVAGLFALHPLRAESVAWAAERKDVLSTMFWFLTMIAYARWVRRPSRGRYALVFAALGLGLMCKPMLVTLPFVLLLLDIWPLGRWRVGGVSVEGVEPVPWRRLVAEKLPLFGLVVVSSAVTAIVQARGGAVGSVELVSLPARVANAMTTYGVYLWQTVWPSGLCCFYPHGGTEPTGMYWAIGAVAGAIVLAVTLIVIKRAACCPYVAIGWLWYAGTAVPVIGLVQVGQQAHADRYTYVTTIGFLIAVVWGVRELAVKRGWSRLGLRWGGIAVVLGLGALAVRQVDTWRDSAALWQRAIDVTTDNATAHLNLGSHWLDRDELDAAARELSRALQLRPDNAGTLLNLGLLEHKRKNLQGAVDYLREAIRRLPPADPSGHYNLGVVLLENNQLAPAIEQFTRATTKRPDYVDAWTNLGVARFYQKQYAEATQALRQALTLAPGAANAHNVLGAVMLASGDARGALIEFRAAFQLDGLQFDAANNVAWILATSRDGSLRNGTEALRFADHCVKSVPNNAQFMRTLAAAYAETGNFPMARQWQQGAMAVQALPEDQAILQGYRRNQPLRR